MDRTSILVIVVCLAVLLLWSWVLVPKYFTKAAPPGATNLPPTVATVTNQTPGASNPAPILEAPAAAPALAANTNIPEQLVVLANENARYTFSSYGGGLK